MNHHLKLRFLKTLCLSILLSGLVGCGEDTESSTSDDNISIVDTDDSTNETDGSNNDNETDGSNNDNETDGSNNDNETDGSNNDNETDGSNNDNETDGSNNDNETDGSNNDNETDGSNNDNETDGSNNDNETDGSNNDNETDGSNNDNETDGSNNDNETDGSNNDNETDGSNNDNETDGSNNDNETDGSNNDNETDGSNNDNETDGSNNDNETISPTTAVNLALNKQVTQSSVAFSGEATRAIDGNTDGAFKNGSVTHTGSENQAWWQVDLNANEYIAHINIYNRTDDCCTSRLSDFYLLVSETPFISNDLNQSLEQSDVTSFHVSTEVDVSITINVELSGRYVRVQQAGSGSPISLAEVEVISAGEVIATPPPAEPTEEEKAAEEKAAEEKAAEEKAAEEKAAEEKAAEEKAAEEKAAEEKAAEEKAAEEKAAEEKAAEEKAAEEKAAEEKAAEEKAAEEKAAEEKAAEEKAAEEKAAEEKAAEEKAAEEKAAEEKAAEEKAAEEKAAEEKAAEEKAAEEKAAAEAQALIDYASGEAIYQAQCSICHAALENSFKRDRTEAQIRQAVLIIPNMQHIALTDKEYQLLEFVLNNEPPLASEKEDDSSSEALPAGDTLLARITNEEFVNSTMALLSIESTDSIESAKETMGAETNVLGLLNDASTQLLTQVALSGYINMIDALLDVYFEEATTEEAMIELYGCESSLIDCGKSVTNKIAEQAFRRPLTEQEIIQISSLFDAVTESYEEADLEVDQYSTLSHQIRFRSAMYYILLSPDFLFMIETGTDDVDSNGELYLSSQEIATRMAFFLTGNLPDNALLAAAEENTLQDPMIRAEQTDRLLNSSSGEQQIANVLKAWLAIKDNLDASSSDPLDAFLLDWVANDKPFSDLYQAPINVDHVDGATSVEPFGILGLNAFVTSHTEFPSPSFINRGLFVVERLLCEKLPDDIPAAALESGELTEVEAFEVHSQDACASCHRVFDNYGAAFQQFDPETSLFDVNNLIFGSSFDLYDIGDVVNEISDLSDLSAEMANSQTASACMAELWYRDALRRNIDTDDTKALAYLMAEWESSQDMSIKSLLKAIVTSDVFVTLYL